MPDIPCAADVVIIGAGVIGCSTAYHLTRMGVADVVIVEMGQMGSGSSSKSASILTLQLATDELSARMVQYCYDRYMHLEEELGVSIDFRRLGRLALATDSGAAELRAQAEQLRALGIPLELLEPDEIQQRYPHVNVEDIVCGTWSTDTGTFDPHMIMSGLCRRARGRGARLLEGVRATALVTRNYRVTGVITTKGTIATQMVVNAAGPWAAEVGSWVGVDIPLLNRARTVLVTGPFPHLPAEWPFVDDLDAGWYCRREGPGILMGMGVVPTDDLSAPFQTDMVDPIINAAVHRIPILDKAELLTGWTGIRPCTPDDRPIVGPVEAVADLLLNCGWNGEGIIMAPIAGQLLAECIVHGEASTIDITPLAVERFAAGSAPAVVRAAGGCSNGG
jgi:sarcosine oxidase subunit beta